MIGAQKCTVLGPTGLFHSFASPLCSASAVAVLCILRWNGVRMELRNVGAAPARAAPKRRRACRAGILNGPEEKTGFQSTDDELRKGTGEKERRRRARLCPRSSWGEVERSGALRSRSLGIDRATSLPTSCKAPQLQIKDNGDQIRLCARPTGAALPPLSDFRAQCGSEVGNGF